MALHHNDLFNSRRPVAAVRDDPSTPEKTRTRLAAVENILRFARAAGLKTEGAYGYYIETKESVVSHLVQAAHPDRLEFITWWFPVVGSVPYMGFFAQAERDAKAEELRAQGYDVHVGGAGAFSSLGWFEDPIFSSMLNRGEADLAHLFFHELTHRTLWIPGTVEFNENLAEYVAGELTEAYLSESGLGALISPYEAKQRDRRRFRTWLQELKSALSAVYQTYDGYRGQAPDLLRASKQAVIRRHMSPPLKPGFESVDYVADEEWNNASILAAALYAPDLERFARAHGCLADARPKALLDALARATKAIPDAKGSEPAFAALDALCRQ